MNDMLLQMSRWLWDYYLHATGLLTVTLLAALLIRQPARRMALHWSISIALVALAILCTLPGWSIIHLISAPPEPAPVFQPVAELPPGPPIEQVPSEIVPPFDATPLMAPSIDPLITEESVLQAESTAIEIDYGLLSLYIAVAGSVLTLLWQALGHWQLNRLRLGAVPAPVELRKALDALVTSGGDAPELSVSDKLQVAVAVGLRRPQIILPKALVQTSSPPSLQTVLDHELAHVQHRDLWLLALLRVLMLLLWAHPLYWLWRRGVRLDQETLADAAAADLSSRDRYAEQLVDWARNAAVTTAPRVAASVGLWESPSQLKRRLSILLDEKLTLLRRCSRQWRIGAMLLIAGLAGTLSLVTLQPATETVAEETGDTEVEVETADQSEVLPQKVTFVRLVVDADDSMTFEGQSTNWEQLPKLLEAVPDRAKTVLEVGIASEEVTVRKLNELKTRAAILANEHGFSYSSDIGVHPLGSKGSQSSSTEVKPKAESSPAKNSEEISLLQELVEIQEQNVERQLLLAESGGATGLDAIRAKSALAAAKADLAQAAGKTTEVREHYKAMLEYAEVEYEAGKRLYDDGRISLTALQQINEKVLKARLKVLQSQSAKAVPMANAADEQIEHLQELVVTQDKVYKRVLALNKNGQAGGEAKNVSLAGYHLANAQAELAKALGDRTQFIAHLREAVMHAEQTASATQAVYESGRSTLGELLEANELKTKAKLELSKALKEAGGNTATGAAKESINSTDATSKVRAKTNLTFDDLEIEEGESEVLSEDLIPDRIKKLVGKQVVISGLVYPTMKKQGIKQFLLVRDTQEEYSLRPWFDSVFITMKAGLTVDYTIRPVRVTGTFSLGEMSTGENGEKRTTYFAIDADQVVLHKAKLKRKSDGTSGSVREIKEVTTVQGETSIFVDAAEESGNQPDSDDTLSIDGMIAGTLGEPPAKGTLVAAPVQEDAVVAFQATGESGEIAATEDKPGSDSESGVVLSVEDGVVFAPVVSDAQFTAVKDAALSRSPFQFDPQSSKPNTIQGRCLGIDGQPAEGLRVSVYRTVRGAAPKLLKSAISDAQGNYAITDVLPENELPSADNSPSGYLTGAPSYLVTFQKKGSISRSFSGFADMIARGITSTLTLEPAATLTGRIANASGKPVTGAVVSANRQAQLPTILGFQSAVTDGDGRYEITDAIPFDLESHEKAKQNSGPWTLYSLAAGPMHSANPAMTLDPLLKVTHPDYATKKVHYDAIPGKRDVQLDAPAVIKGRVLGLDGEPQSGVRLHVMSSKPFEAGQKVTPDDAHQAYAETDDAGEYQVAGLPAGRYELKIQTPEHSKAMPAWVSEGISGFESRVGTENRAPDMRLEKGGILRLRLTDSRGGEPIKFKSGDVAQIYIHYPELSQFQSHRSIQAECGSGEFMSLRVLPGNMQVRVFHAGSPYDNDGTQPEWGHLSHDPKVKEVTVAVGETATLEYALSNRSAFIDAQKAAMKALQNLDDEEAQTRALEVLRKVLTAGPYDDGEMQSIHNLRVHLLMKMERHAEVIEAYEEMIKLDTPVRDQYRLSLASYLTFCSEESLRDYSRSAAIAKEFTREAREDAIQGGSKLNAFNTLASAYRGLGKLEESLRTREELVSLLSELIETHPDSPRVIQWRFMSASQRIPLAEGRATRAAYRGAISELEKLLADVDTEILTVDRIARSQVANNLAHLLATCPVDELRDGKRAVELAQQAAQMFGAPQADMLDTLAAAYAEVGDFEKAIASQQQAIKLGRPDQQKKMKQHLELYRQEKPLRTGTQ